MATNGANYIPDRTINFNVTADEGNIFLGVGTVDLPEIQKMTDTLSGSGIAGEVETPIPGHFQSMETTINWNAITTEALNLLRDGPVSLTESRRMKLMLLPMTIRSKLSASICGGSSSRPLLAARRSMPNRNKPQLLKLPTYAFLSTMRSRLKLTSST